MNAQKSRKGGKACIVTEPSSTRERILNAAFATFVERGYAGASTLEIATRAKVSKRELYANFKNKQALLAAGISQRTERMRLPLDLPEITNRQALRGALKAYGTAVLTGVTDPHVIAIYRLAIAESAQSPELAATLDRSGRLANRRILVEILSRARARGLTADCDIEAMADAFIGLLWTDLMARLLLGVAKRPTLNGMERRAKIAADAFLALRGAEGQ